MTTDSRVQSPVEASPEPAAEAGGVELLFTQVTFPTPSLMPAVVRRRRSIRTTKRRLGLALMLLVVVYGVWFGISRLELSTAQVELSNAQADLRAAQQAQEQYRDVPAVFAAVKAGQEELAQAMGSEVQTARLVSQLSVITPQGVSLDEVSMVMGVAAQEAVSGTGVTAEDSALVGTVSFSGKAATFNDVSAWVASLRRNADYTNVVLSEVSRDNTTGIYTFTSTAEFTDQALSGRFVEVTK